MRATETGGTAARASADERGPRVLVVKSPIVTGRRYHLALRDNGFDVRTVGHGPEAVAAVMAAGEQGRRGAYDLVLVEVADDGGAGTIFLDLLRRYLGDATTPVIVLSPRADRLAL